MEQLTFYRYHCSVYIGSNKVFLILLRKALPLGRICGSSNISSVFGLTPGLGSFLFHLREELKKRGVDADEEEGWGLFFPVSGYQGTLLFLLRRLELGGTERRGESET